MDTNQQPVEINQQPVEINQQPEDTHQQPVEINQPPVQNQIKQELPRKDPRFVEDDQQPGKMPNNQEQPIEQPLDNQPVEEVAKEQEVEPQLVVHDV